MFFCAKHVCKMQTHFEDSRLKSIHAKVEAGERLSFDDGIALNRTQDLLGLGYLANLVRERLHGDRTYFNVNRHINPTDVCVASCRLCAFGKSAKDPKAYTMSLEEVWHRAGEGYREAVTEFHIVGGLHPQLNLDWYCQMLRGLKERYPQVHLKAFTMVEIGYFAKREKIAPREVLRAIERRRDGFDAGRRGGNFQRSRAAHHLRPQAYRRGVDRDGAHGARTWAALQLHDALRAHRERRRPRRSPRAAARTAG